MSPEGDSYRTTANTHLSANIVKCVRMRTCIALLLIAVPLTVAADGEALYNQWCAACHSVPQNTSPHITSLNAMNRGAFLAALDGGVMATQAVELSGDDKLAIADFVVGKSDGQDWDWRELRCEGGFELNNTGNRHWGFDPSNSRHVESGLLGEPELKWAFAYPNATRARSQPAYVDGMLFFGSDNGTVYAMDAARACIHWTFAAGHEVRTGITVIGDVENPMLVFGDFAGRVHALNATTGEQLWRVRPEVHATATITAQPQYHNGVVYTSISSREFLAGASPAYDCCTFRGSVVALNVRSGETIWQSYVIEEPASKVGERESGTSIFAPSGAPIWNTAAIDTKRNQLYVGTGENYSRPTSKTSDAIIAMDLDTGQINWVRQTIEGDAWNVACNRGNPNPVNCPSPRGPDLDFGAPPILVSTERGDILVAGQKSGWVFGLSPDNGEVIWSTKAGRGGGQGGVHFGMAVADGKVFVPIFDGASVVDMASEDPRMPGMHALDVESGKLLWSTIADDVCEGRRFCSPGISAPVTALNGYVLAGHSDGRFRAYDADTGDVLWTVETDREFETINGLPGSGGSMGGGTGPVVADGMVYLNSGYSSLRHMPGNVLLAIKISGK